MLFQLFDRGEVRSLDDPITDYCPSFSMRNPFDEDNVITLRCATWIWDRVLLYKIDQLHIYAS